MFKSTRHFFNSVRKCKVSQIDIVEFVKSKTSLDTDKLTILLSDLEMFINIERDDREADISDNDWLEMIEYYKSKGKELPIKKLPNIDKTLRKQRGIDVSNEPDVVSFPNVEKIFFPAEFFCLYQLKNYLVELMEGNCVKESDNTHSEVFANEGFILFSHIMTNYVKPVGTRGRLSDIGYFYWKLHNNEPQFIHQRPEFFKSWFYKIYKEDLGKIKTLDNLKTIERERAFSTALDWLKGHRI